MWCKTIVADDEVVAVSGKQFTQKGNWFKNDNGLFLRKDQVQKNHTTNTSYVTTVKQARLFFFLPLSVVLQQIFFFVPTKSKSRWQEVKQQTSLRENKWSYCRFPICGCDRYENHNCCALLYRRLYNFCINPHAAIRRNVCRRTTCFVFLQ